MIIHILCSTDSNYVMPTSVMIKSASVNNAEIEIVFHVLVDDSVTDNHKEQLRLVVSDNKNHSVEFHNVRIETSDSFPSIGVVKEYISKAAYYRLMVADILDIHIEKVIYLDVDVIVDGSLEGLWNYDVNDYAIGAIIDMSDQLQDFQRLGYPSDSGYFNSGVLLINLKYWRKYNVRTRFIELIDNYPEKIIQHDQDVLNIVFFKEKILLPFRYNVQNGFLYNKETLGIDADKYKDELVDCRKNYVIIHYTGPFKPWYKDCLHPMKDLWFKYYKLTELPPFIPKRKCDISLRTKMGNILRSLKLLPQLSQNNNPFEAL